MKRTTPAPLVAPRGSVPHDTMPALCKNVGVNKQTQRASMSRQLTVQPAVQTLDINVQIDTTSTCAGLQHRCCTSTQYLTTTVHDQRWRKHINSQRHCRTPRTFTNSAPHLTYGTLGRQCPRRIYDVHVTPRRVVYVSESSLTNPGL